MINLNYKHGPTGLFSYFIGLKHLFHFRAVKILKKTVVLMIKHTDQGCYVVPFRNA